jgi:hypothetical protein
MDARKPMLVGPRTPQCSRALPPLQVVSRGFTPIMTPDLVKEAVLEKCGFQPRGAGTQVQAHLPTTAPAPAYRLLARCMDTQPADPTTCPYGFSMHLVRHFT